MLVTPPESVRQRGTVHLVPNQFDVERVLADEKALEVLVNDAAGERAAAVVRAKATDALVGENLDDERVLPAAHPERTDARVFRVDRHGVGNERLACQPPPQYCDSPIAAPRAPVSPDLTV